MKLDGKSALIAGGGEGIGRATALLFCNEGANVGIMGRTFSKLEQVVNESDGPGVYPLMEIRDHYGMPAVVLIMPIRTIDRVECLTQPDTS